MITTASKYMIKGLNDSETTCACCGRNDLKRVVWLTAIDADGNETTVEAYGTTCAARLLSPKGQSSEARSLTSLAKAYEFVAKYIDSEYTLDQITSTVGVRFNVWATVEDNTIRFNTSTGWVTVATR